ncbi:MAG: ATP-binding protein [Bacteroidia bacterium]|nr:ATP-binding protein [Bacteroidia bacterium]
MIARTLSETLLGLRGKFPVCFLTGPRQSGKTTLLKALIPDLPYVSLEEPDLRAIALQDPRGFLDQFPAGLVLDEAQRAPALFSYIQGRADADPEIRYYLSGSQNFLLSEKITQSLAGRTAVLSLLPLSLAELHAAGFRFGSFEEVLFRGQYPRCYDRQIEPHLFYPSYVQTYVERDVRQMKNIGDLDAFIRFLQLCAGRIGQPLNLSSLAQDAGISANTAKSWMSILQASFLVFTLQPYFRNVGTRAVKSPKLYFHDTGLACYLLGISEAGQLFSHYLRGSLFENLVLSELVKHRLHRGQKPGLYFWTDKSRREVDCLIERGTGLRPVEIKSGKTMLDSYFDTIRLWQKLSGEAGTAGFVVYGGDASFTLPGGRLLSWRDMEELWRE